MEKELQETTRQLVQVASEDALKLISEEADDVPCLATAAQLCVSIDQLTYPEVLHDTAQV